MAYDEGAWHPNNTLLVLWLVSAVLSLIPQIMLAAEGRRRPIYYVGIALPFVGLFALNLYVNYGNSGEYTGYGAIGPGAHLNLIWSLLTTGWQVLLVAPPVLIVVLIAHWNSLRRKRPAWFWSLMGLALLIEVSVGGLVDLILVAAMME